MIPIPTAAERAAHRATLARLTGRVSDPCVWESGTCKVRERLEADVAKWIVQSSRALRGWSLEFAIRSKHRAIRELAAHACETREMRDGVH